MKTFFGIIMLFVIGIPITLFGGVVFSDFWRWFIVPVFDAPALTYLQAVGVMLTAYLLIWGMGAAWAQFI